MCLNIREMLFGICTVIIHFTGQRKNLTLWRTSNNKNPHGADVAELILRKAAVLQTIWL